jgi:hypothetical protein
VISQALLQEHDGWLHFASLSGERGRLWVEEFRRPESFGIIGTAGSALPLLHRRERRQIEQGRRLLEEAETRLSFLRNQGTRPSILAALDQIYYPLLAYYHYATEELALAGQDLDRADQAIGAAVELEPFLLPLAFRCSEFELHRARIARNRRRWEEMRLHLDRALGMVVHESHPLCVRPDGTGVTLTEVKAFFRDLPRTDADMETFARQLTDDAARHRLFDRFVLGIYTLPGFVIPYP